MILVVQVRQNSGQRELTLHSEQPGDVCPSTKHLKLNLSLNHHDPQWPIERTTTPRLVHQHPSLPARHTNPFPVHLPLASIHPQYPHTSSFVVC